MNIIQKFRSLDRVSKCAVILFGTVATIYGGSKHTNNVPPRLGLCLGPRSTEEFLCPPPPHLSTITNWHARGAWNDWLDIDFPDGFSFPLGYSRIQGVTLMSQGALRSALTNATPLVLLPYALALEPGVSTVTHGLTSSNSYLFAWQDAYADRDPSNVVNAAIELFPNGSITTWTTSAVQPPTFNLQPPVVPEGYYGHGQDLAWATNAFPWAASAIAQKGYEDWLMEDYVGINQQNGRYKATITIDSLSSNGAPCYLECGSYKVIVAEPGDYSFPLEVFEHYAARTYPDALPLSVAYDEGYRSDGMGLASPTPPLMMSAPFMMPPFLLDIHMEPEFRIEPPTVYVHSNESALVSVWVNAVNYAQKTWYSYSMNTALVWLTPTYARIYDAEVNDRVVFNLVTQGHEISGPLEVIRLPDPNQTTMCEYCSITNCPCFGWCHPGCPCHPDGTNTCVHAVSQ